MMISELKRMRLPATKHDTGAIKMGRTNRRIAASMRIAAFFFGTGAGSEPLS
jgi:hypothetical protein